MDADDDAIGLHEVFDGEAFAKEFWIADDVELDFRFAIAGDGFGDFLAGLYRDGAFINDYFVTFHRAGDVAGDALDEGEVDGAVGLGRGGDGDEDNVGIADAIIGGGGEGEAAFGDVGLDHFFETRLVDGNAAGL